MTIRDVAAAAGVSPATVSRALTQPGRVTIETANRIRSIADELGYRVRTVTADPFDGKLLGEIGALVPDFRYSVFGDYLYGIQRQCKTRDYKLAVSVTEDQGDEERELINSCLKRVDGLLLIASRVPDTVIRKAAQAKPVVVVNRLVRGVQSVVVDDRPSVEAAVLQLKHLGHRSVTYVPWTQSSWQNGLRWQALLTVCHREGLRLRRLGVPQPPEDGMDGDLSATVDEFLESPTSAIIAYNDFLAGGIIRELIRRGIGVPGEVSVIGFDNTPIGQMSTPRLATIGVDREEVGALAATRLIERVLHIDDSGSAPVVQASHFEMADSVGPAPSSEIPGETAGEAAGAVSH